MKRRTVLIGADHAGFRLKRLLVPYLRSLGFAVADLGAKKLVTTDDYPAFAFAVAKGVAGGKGPGVLVCGSSHGVCMAANKVRGVRAASVLTVHDARLVREHNDANVLCLSGWGMHADAAKAIARAVLATPFSGEKRHLRRLKQIAAFEKKVMKRGT